MIRPQSFWPWAKPRARSATRFKSSLRQAATSCRPSLIGELAELGKDSELRRITSRFVVASGRGGILPLLVYGAVSIYSLRDATRQIGHHRQRERRAASRRADRPLRSNQRRHSAVGRRQSRRTRISQQWQQDRILKNAVLDFPEFREITLYDAAGAQLASSRVGQSKLQFPQSGHELRTEHHAVADRHRRRLPADSGRRHQADAARPKLQDRSSAKSASKKCGGWSIGSASATRATRSSSPPNGQLIAHGNSEREAARRARRQPREPAARPPRARPAQRRARLARIRQRSGRADARRRRAARAARLDGHGRAAAQRGLRRRRRS